MLVRKNLVVVKKVIQGNQSNSKSSNNNKGKSDVLDIRQSEGDADIFHTSWIVIGPPGIGKSTLYSGFEDVLFLVTSTKEVKRLKVPYILIDSWDKLLEVTDELINNREKYSYKFIAIDFIDAIWTMCVIAVCEKLKITHPTDAAYGKGTDTVDGFFKKWVTQMIASDYSILFVSHVVQKDVIVQGGTITKTICTLVVRARNILFPLVNVIGCMDYKNIKQPSKTQPGKIELVKKRVIQFEGTDYIEAKDRDSMLPAELVLHENPVENYKMFKEYYDGIRKK
jgi:hypothetical protein